MVCYCVYIVTISLFHLDLTTSFASVYIHNRLDIIYYFDCDKLECLLFLVSHDYELEHLLFCYSPDF